VPLDRRRLHGRLLEATLTIAPVTAAEGGNRIREVLDALVHERQELRRTHAGPTLLEANRLAIVYWQQKLNTHLVAEGGGRG
jgi:hypothetical protein